MGSGGSVQGKIAKHLLQTGLSCFCLSIFALLSPSCLRRANNAFVTSAHRDDAVLTAEIAKFSQAGILRNLSLLTQDLKDVVSADVVHKFEGDLLLDLANNYASFADLPDDRDGRAAWLKEKQIRLIMQLLDKESLGRYLASLENIPKIAPGELAVGVDSFAEYLDFHLSQLKAQPQTGRVLDREKLLNEKLDDAVQRQQHLRRTYRNDLPFELSQLASARPKIVEALEASSESHEAGEWWISVPKLRERLLWNDEDYCFLSDLWCVGELQTNLDATNKLLPACRQLQPNANPSSDVSDVSLSPGALFLTIEQNLLKARKMPKRDYTRMRRGADVALHRVAQTMCMWFLSPIESLTRRDDSQKVSPASNSAPQKDTQSQSLSDDLLSKETVYSYSARIRRAVDDRLSHGMTAALGKNLAGADPDRVKRLKRDALYVILSQRDLKLEVEKEIGQPRRDIIAKQHITVALGSLSQSRDLQPPQILITERYRPYLREGLMTFGRQTRVQVRETRDERKTLFGMTVPFTLNSGATKASLKAFQEHIEGMVKTLQEKGAFSKHSDELQNPEELAGLLFRLETFDPLFYGMPRKTSPRESGDEAVRSSVTDISNKVKEAGDQFIEKEKFLAALHSWSTRNTIHGLEEYNRASFFPVVCGDDGGPGRRERTGLLANKITLAIKAPSLRSYSTSDPEATKAIALCLMWVFELESQLRLLES